MKQPKEYVFLDIETSGLKPYHEILEIGGLITDENFQIKEKFNYLIKMENPQIADQKSLRIINYSEERWKNALPLKEVLKILYPKFKNKILVGFNSHFDWARLEKAFYQNGFDDPFYYKKIDVLSLVYLKLGYFPDQETLGSACKIFQIERGKAHQAFDDAYATYKLFIKLKELEKNE